MNNMEKQTGPRNINETIDALIKIDMDYFDEQSDCEEEHQAIMVAISVLKEKQKHEATEPLALDGICYELKALNVILAKDRNYLESVYNSLDSDSSYGHIGTVGKPSGAI